MAITPPESAATVPVSGQGPTPIRQAVAALKSLSYLRCQELPKTPISCTLGDSPRFSFHTLWLLLTPYSEPLPTHQIPPLTGQSFARYSSQQLIKVLPHDDCRWGSYIHVPHLHTSRMASPWLYGAPGHRLSGALRGRSLQLIEQIVFGPRPTAEPLLSTLDFVPRVSVSTTTLFSS